MRVHHEQSAVELVRHHHLVHYRDRDSRIVAQPAHPSVARVQSAVGASLDRERNVSAIVVADLPPQLAIAGGGAELLDPGVLVRRDRLVRELAADPMGLLRENDPASEPRGSEGGSAGTQPSADDGNIRPQRFHAISRSPLAPCRRQLSTVVRSMVPARQARLEMVRQWTQASFDTKTCLSIACLRGQDLGTPCSSESRNRPGSR
jgi:hypothetical protein